MLPAETSAFEMLRLDLAELVGREIRLYTDQIPGKELRSKVLAVQDRQLQIFTGGPTSLIENLVNNQNVVLQYVYRGEELAVRARLRRAGGGKCYLHLEEKVTPLRQRRFRRVTLTRPVRLAVFPMNPTTRAGLGQLRWLATDSINFSAGGSMVALPSGLERRTYLLASMDIHDLDFPSLILCQVCHAHQSETGPFRTGLEFVTREQSTRVVPPERRRDLPGAIFDYSAEDREKLNRTIMEWPADMEFKQ
ncbi:MAG: hypothetical protein HY851_05455 [candidate division Zixibacteria bacterium]|nr:hypothetical protein [candidate division Zixibacteria bacterium]